MLKTRDIKDVEILSVGTWHGTGCPVAGCTFAESDLDSIADAYSKTKGVLRPPAKLGHDDNQKLLQADGYPAAGWLANVRRVGKTLLADIMQVPNKLAELIDAGAYRTRSVELEADYDVAGTKYPMVLTAMAFLGADLPAVESLSDITALYASRKLSAPSNGRIIVFSAPPAATFALPEGMSYEDLMAQVRTAFVDASPGAAACDSVWVSDIYDDAAIINLEGRYWRQAYAVGDDGAVTLSGFPTEVQRVTEWQAVAASRGRMTYADNAEHVLTDVQAFIARSGELASLRAKDGRALSEKHRARLASLRDGLRDAQDKLDAFIEAEPEPHEDQDYARVMRARLRIAELRQAELIGA